MNARTPPSQEANDTMALRRSLGCFPTGVAVVTTVGRDGAPIGVTISSFNAVSLDPPLILWSLAVKAASLLDFRAARHFAVNVLTGEQTDLPRIFSSPVDERFDGLSWAPGLGGVPVLDDCAAVFECRTHARHDGGDHEIMLGEVIRHQNSQRPPLVFARGRLSTLAEPAHL